MEISEMREQMKQMREESEKQNADRMELRDKIVELICNSGLSISESRKLLERVQYKIEYSSKCNMECKPTIITRISGLPDIERII